MFHIRTPTALFPHSVHDHFPVSLGPLIVRPPQVPYPLSNLFRIYHPMFDGPSNINWQHCVRPDISQRSAEREQLKRRVRQRIYRHGTGQGRLLRLQDGKGVGKRGLQIMQH